MYAYRLLAEDIYTNPTRFVYELLQNAEDAGAKKARFQLMHHRLNFSHDGKAFSREDVESITAFGASTKLSEEGKIGKFGVGFKSVHSVTKTPHIHSEEFHFQIEDYIVPNEIPSDKIPQMEKSETRIVLPFNVERDNSAESYKRTLAQLEDLNINCLLFLRHIGEISWKDKSGENMGRYTKYHEGEFVILKMDAGENQECRKYLVYDKNVSINDKTMEIHIAYRIDKNGMIVPAEERHEKHVFVFFPTNEGSHLKFCIQAPYKPILSREGVNFDDEENHQLTKELACLVSESMRDLKKRNLLTPNFFLQILPRTANEGDISPCSVISNELTSVLRREALLPAHGGNQHIKAKDAVLSSEKGLMKCLVAEDIAVLFSRGFWLPPTLDGIRSFLKSIGVALASFDLFLDVIQEHGDFVKSKKDGWLVDLYKELEQHIEDGSYYEKEKRKKKVGKASIIRLNSGEMVAPWGDDDKPQVYLPYDDGRESEFCTVKRDIAKHPEAKKLFQALGINQPSALSEIKEKIAPRYREKDHDTEFGQHLADMKNIRKTFDEENDKVRAGIKDVLKNAYIVRTGQGEYVNPSKVNVYIPSEEVEAWFGGNSESYIADEKVVNEIKSREFYERLGCKKIDGISQFSDPESHSHGWHEVPVDDFNPTFSIDGLEHSVQNINVQRSRILWQQLLKHYKHIRGYVRKDGDKNYVYRVDSVEENSKVGECLSKNMWLYDKQKNLIELSEYAEKTVDDLHDEYDTEDTRAASLAASLGLSSKTCSIEEANKRVQDARQEEAAKWESKLKDSERENLELKEKLRKMENEKKNDNDWSPECHPGEGKLTEVTPGQLPEPHGGMGGHGAPEKSSKSVGDWGERDVYLFLEGGGHEVEWCNEHDEQRKPFDIIVRNGNSTVYVEVKSTRNDFPQTFNFTKSEWEFAEEHGDNYHVYFVSRAGKLNRELVRIENPVAEEQAGRLYVMANEAVTYRVRVNKSDD